MHTKLSYEEYYQQQMLFLHNYMMATPHSGDTLRNQRIDAFSQKQSIIIHPDFLAADPRRLLDTTKVGYLPTANTDVPGFLAPNPTDDGVDELRSYSCYRIVHGPIPFYLDNQFEEATVIPVLSTCAPNLMGSSPKDLKAYSEGFGTKERALRKGPYKEQCQKLADFIVRTAKDQGYNCLVMPPFGVGVYIKTLAKPSKKEATKIMFEAFAAAAERHELSIDWTIWDKSDNPERTKQILKNYARDNGFINPVITNDIITYTAHCRAKGCNAVMLNPGSDRTIGGHYTARNPKTLEEQMAQQSDLVLLHSAFNADMVRRFYAERPGFVAVDGEYYWCGIRILSKEETTKNGGFPFDQKELTFLAEHKAVAPNIRVLAHNLLWFHEQNDTLIDMPDTATYSAKSPADLEREGFEKRKKTKRFQPAVLHKGDILHYAEALTQSAPEKRFALLNPANRKHVGGGAFLGANALEECYFRQSSLGLAYVKHAFTSGFSYTAGGDKARPDYKQGMKKGESWFTDDVVIRPKDKHGAPFSVGIIGSTAPAYAHLIQARNDRSNAATIKEEIRAQCTAAIKNQVDVPVLTAFGCGAFHNDPKAVARYYWEVLYLEGYADFFDAVHFAIWQDQNPKAAQNFKHFEEVFTELNQTRIVLQQHSIDYYDSVTKTCPTQLSKALELLEDYTKANSCFGAFFGRVIHGTWGRNHIADVEKILEKRAQYKSVDALFTDLNTIALVNSKGALARRIEYIETCLITEKEEPAFQDAESFKI